MGARIINVGESAQTHQNVGLITNGGPSWGAIAGSYNAAVLVGRNTLWSSFIFYRLYVEDLTVSGRSYVTIDAIDLALYQAAVLTSTGRYYSDTYSAPSTVP